MRKDGEHMKKIFLKKGLQRLVSLITMLAVLTASFCIAGIGVFAATSGITIDETNFPDAKLRYRISIDCDSNNDKCLSDEEIASVTKLSLAYYSISSLEGIDIFYNLETLICNYNNLTELDISSFTNLTYLNCSDNDITELDISNNPYLATLKCTGTSITTLNTSDNPLLTTIECDSNVVTVAESHTHSYSAEYSYDELGHWRVCTECGSKETSEAHSIVDNVCTVCGYVCPEEEETEDVDIPLTAEYFPDTNARNNVFSKFDTNSDGVLSQAERDAVTEIKFLYSSNASDITGIEYFSNITSLSASCYNITSIDVSKNKLLQTLVCLNTQIESLDLRANTELTSINCNLSNKLTEIDVSACSKLSYLNCTGTSVTTLDLSKNPLLSEEEGNVLCGSSVSIIWYTGGNTEEQEDPDEQEKTLIQPAYVNVSVEGDLAMYFAFSKSDFDGEDYVACVSKSDEEVTEIPFDDWLEITISDDEYYCVVYDGIAAKEMCEDVTVQIFRDDEAVSEEYTESIRSYAMRVVNKSNVESLKSVMVDLLNYGAAAQGYFGYDTDNLANDLLTDEQLETYASENVSTASDTSSGNSSLYLGASLTLESNITLSMLFDITPGEDTAAVVEYTAYDGTEISKTITDFEAYTSDDGMTYYSVSVDSLSVADVATEITCTIYDGDTEIVTVSESQLSYISRNLGDDGDLDALFTSLLKFGNSVCNYLGYGD